MEITYLGRSCFKLKNKQATLVTDPFNENYGHLSASLSADIVTVSHGHTDHNATYRVKPGNGEQMVIQYAGEYEKCGVSVFGVESWHDEQEGALRGSNIIYTILMDGISICHLGDLGQKSLTDEQISRIGGVDVLLCPVGGTYTLDAKGAVAVMKQIEPKYFIPMHYRLGERDEKDLTEGNDIATLDTFFNEYGIAPQPVPKLVVDDRGKMPEETEVVVLSVG